MVRPDLARSGRLFGLPKGLVAVVPAVAVLVAAALSVTPVSKAQTASQSGAFSPSAWAAKEYPKTVEPYVSAKAVDLAALLTALTSDPATTQHRYGHDAGSGSGYSFPVKVTAKAGADNNGLVPLMVAGVPKKWTVYLQVGPAINGSALRDVTGKFSFGSFENQIDYQDAALALNDQVKSRVLKAIDPSDLNGKTIQVLGAFAQGANPDFVGVVPTSVSTR